MIERKIPIAKNDEIELTIDALTGEGQGIGRIDGYAVFVPGALVGERVRVHIIKITASYAVGKLVELLTQSPQRVQPPCAAYPFCGGCTMMHLSYAAQKTVKETMVRDALERIGGFTDVQVEPILGMREPLRYRNKGSFPFGLYKGTARWGFFAPRSHRLVPLDDCPIQDARITELVGRVAEWAQSYHVMPYDEENKRGVLRHVVARVTRDGASMVTVVTTGPLPHKAELIELMHDTDSLYHNCNDKDTNVIFGERFTLLSGVATLTETINGLKFRVSPQSFLQVNPVQTELLYEKALELLAPKKGERIVDLYCGIGTLTLAAARSGAKLTGIENVPQAIADAKENAALNGLTNVDFLCGDAETVLPKLVAEGNSFDAMLLDPPRKGCEGEALQAIADSGVKRVVYVSCNPATLARDLAKLRYAGFRLAAVQPVDMFPHTPHVECATLLLRETAE